MTRYPQTTREEYEAIQCERARIKWGFTSVTRREVEWIAQAAPVETLGGPILCLGVRNGRELTLFRSIFGPEPEIQGVELASWRPRPDVWVGSFDAMPAEWAGRYGLLYSNALDHAFDPEATAREWRRVAAPGAVLALALDTEKPPTETDPIADIRPGDVRRLFAPAQYLAAYVERPMWYSLWRLA